MCISQIIELFFGAKPLTYKQVIIDSGQKFLLMFPRNQDVYTLLMAYIVRGLQNNNYYDLVKWLLETIKDTT